MAKILLVDDDIDLLTNLQNTLTRSGYAVQVLSEGEQVFEALAAFAPDLVILDINLGDVDGRKLCAAIKKSAAYHEMPVILYSAVARPVREITNCQAAMFIQKPFSYQYFLQQVKHFVHE